MLKRTALLAILTLLTSVVALAQQTPPGPGAAQPEAPPPAPPPDVGPPPATPAGPEAPAAPPGAAPPATPSAVTEDGATHLMPSLSASTGLLRVFSADSGKAGTFRFQLMGEYSRATNLLLRDDTNSHLGGRFALSVSPFDWLEIFAMVTGTSNDNNRSLPTLIQTQGDFTIGVKGCYRVYDFLCIGAEGAAMFLTAAGDNAFTARSTSFLLRLLATTDFRRMAANIPLRIHFNFGGIIDNSDALLRQDFDAVQRFALRVNESSRLFLGLGVDLPVNRWVTPFVEWSFEIPVGLPDLANAAGASAWPNILSLGARVSPWKQLSLLAAFDIGITSSGRLGLPAVPPWQFIFGLGWAFDTSAAPAQVVVQEKVKEVIKEKVVTKEVLVPTPMAPTTGVLTGQVIDSRTAQPVPGAAIKFPGTEHTAALTGEAKGDFKISDLPAGRLRVRVEKDGFKPADFEVDIVAGKPTANSFPVDQAEKVTAMAVLAGKVADEGGNPLTGIVEAREAKSGETKKLVAEPSTGGFVGRLPVGQYVVMARSTGYLSREKTITLNPNERVVVDFTLRKEPEKRIARLEGSKIVIAKQVNFKRASAKIIGKESFAILDEVVDILVRHPNIKKIRVEGHTDNVGGKGYNQKLSESRARSVMEYVVSQGIPPTRLESQGFGQTKPLVPNTSKRNKAKNRRVDFVIVDQ